MKAHEMTNLYALYNEEEDFRILVCAFDIHEAYEFAREYGLDSCLNGDWDIEDFDANTHFDCDYVISGGF